MRSDTETMDMSPNVLKRAVEVETRLGGGLRVELHGLVVEVQRGEALVVVASFAALMRGSIDAYMPSLAQGLAGLVVVGFVPEYFLERFPASTIVAHVTDLAQVDPFYLAIAGALERAELRIAAERRAQWLTRYRYELGELIEIARAMSRERDLEMLLGLILEKCRSITNSDAGSIYVVETAGDERQLRFKLSQNDTVSFESREFVVPMTTRSIAGAAAVLKRPINIPDVYDLTSVVPGRDGSLDSGFTFDGSFDSKVGYKTRSMIAVPLISAESEVIGVIQLINRKKDPAVPLDPSRVEEHVVPYDRRSEELLATLATQAGIALENAMLYDEIRRIFDGFVRASVQAIEQRDPTTSGHSQRVSVLSVALARTVDLASVGPYAEVHLSRRDLKELEVASLLHDFGKIGVREEVLVKAKKLYPHQLDAVRARFEYAALKAELRALEAKVEAIRGGATEAEVLRIELGLEQEKARLRSALDFIEQANEPTVLKEGDFSRIAEIACCTYSDPKGETRPLLREDEVTALQVTRGSLHARELEQIRSHVVHTRRFLEQIPWGKNFANIPLIAGAHHERLNGTGYPEGRTAETIPLASKIMSIADIFDALTARDRPYKKAMPTERALDILAYEVKDGHIDRDLVGLFVEARCWEILER